MNLDSESGRQRDCVPVVRVTSGQVDSHGRKAIYIPVVRVTSGQIDSHGRKAVIV